MSGRIELILGPMFSGKSTELVRRIRRYTISNLKCALIKYLDDDRYSVDDISTHDDTYYKSTFKTRKLCTIAHTALTDMDVIGIDEGQFFPDLVDFCETMANLGKTVIVAGLDGTFQRKPFGRILDLIPMAEEVVKLKAICTKCYKDAAFSRRIDTTKDEVEIIGGSETYVANCRACYFADSSPQQ